MTMHPAIPPPPPRDTVQAPPPDDCDDLPFDGEPASGVRSVIDAARLRAEWEREQALLDPLAPWWRDLALDAEAGQ